MSDPFDEKEALKEVGQIGDRIDAIIKKIDTEDPGRPADPAPESDIAEGAAGRRPSSNEPESASGATEPPAPPSDG